MISQLRRVRWKRMLTWRRLLTTAVLLALTVSVVLNIMQYRRSSAMKCAWYEARLNPLGLSWYSSVSAAPVVSVAMYGDSRAGSWPMPAGFADSWVNLGVGGQTSAQILARYAWDLRPCKAKIVVIQGGINDLEALALFPERRDEIVENTKRHLAELVAMVRKDNGRVVLSTIMPRGDQSAWERFNSSADVDVAIREVNEYLRKLGSEDVRILDAYALLEEGGRVAARFQLDQHHINGFGYLMLNKELVRILKDW